jgi:hypothetical protein
MSKMALCIIENEPAPKISRIVKMENSTYNQGFREKVFNCYKWNPDQAIFLWGNCTKHRFWIICIRKSLHVVSWNTLTTKAVDNFFNL